MRPVSGSSTMARSPTVSETVARSVFEHLRLRFDAHGFGERADLQRGVRAHHLVGGELDPGGLERLEAGDA